MISEADPNNTGELTFYQFKQIVMEKREMSVDLQITTYSMLTSPWAAMKMEVVALMQKSS